MRTQSVYRELTGRGKAVCALAGVVEEILIFQMLGLRSFACPLLLTGFVVIFLWFLFAVLTGAGMIGADEVWQMLRGSAHGAYGPAVHAAVARNTAARNAVVRDTGVMGAEKVYAKAS